VCYTASKTTPECVWKWFMVAHRQTELIVDNIWKRLKVVVVRRQHLHGP